MTLLRIGQATINTDHVREIYTGPTGESVVVRFGGSPDIGQLGFSGDEAKALICWLDSHATNLTPATEMDQEWEAYKAKGGMMPRERFEADVRELRELNRRADQLDSDAPEWKRVMDRAGRLEGRLLL